MPDQPEPARRSDGAAPKRPALTRALDGISGLCAAVAGVCMVALVVIFAWLVYGRYVLNDTPTWVEKTSELLIAYIAYLGAAVGVRESVHLSIDFIREAMPRALRFAMRATADLALIVLGVLMAWYGWRLFQADLTRPIPLIGLSESWRDAPLALSGVLIVIFGIGDLIERSFLGGRSVDLIGRGAPGDEPPAEGLF